NILVKDHRYIFDWTDGVITYKGLTTGLPGEHNVENAVAAVTVTRSLGLSEEAIRQGLSSYAGVKRRFDYQVQSPEAVFIDDYAHHPEELRACIRSARDLYPGKKITGIFQPHLFTRTRDFADGFAESLSMLDELLLMEIYPARESPIPGVTSAMLIDKITTPLKKLCSPEQVLDHIRSNKPEVLLTLGAGDIDQLVMPIRTLLEKKS
ncbi:MAG: glutamate ligase domain-containing protein, partial [Bacteroidota bacterium]